MTKDGLVSRTEHILMTYSKEELTAGVECDGVWYALNGNDLLKHVAAVSEPGTLLICKPYPLTHMVNGHVHVKFGDDEYGCLFAIQKTSFEELERKVRKCIASHNKTYTELWSSSRYSLYYRSDTDRFELTEWRHYLHGTFYYDVYYGKTIVEGCAWYYVNEDHAPFHFGLKEAMKKMNGNTLDDGFERLKAEYIFTAGIRCDENKTNLLECYSRTPTIRLNGQKNGFH